MLSKELKGYCSDLFSKTSFLTGTVVVLTGWLAVVLVVVGGIATLFGGGATVVVVGRGRASGGVGPGLLQGLPIRFSL